MRHKILVLSGKGGVGKSTFATQLAFALAAGSREVCCDSVPSWVLLAQHLHCMTACRAAAREALPQPQATQAKLMCFPTHRYGSMAAQN